MLRGLYTAASGMNHELNRQDAIANNLANINTAGFKKDEMIGASFHAELYYAIDRGSSAADRDRAPWGGDRRGLYPLGHREYPYDRKPLGSGDHWCRLFCRRQWSQPGI